MQSPKCNDSGRMIFRKSTATSGTEFKHVIKGGVTDKRSATVTIVDDTEVLFKRSDRVRRWYVSIGEEEFEVEKQVDDAILLGVPAEAHLAPESGFLLQIRQVQPHSAKPEGTRSRKNIAERGAKGG